MYFIDRRDAGRELAKALKSYINRTDTIVLALPRGGVPVAFEVANALHLPLDLMLVRKLGVPENEELAMGAIAIGDVVVLNNDIVQHLFISPKVIDRIIESEKAELARRNKVYRGGRHAPNLQDKKVILIDDGMATGANMRAAVQAVKQQKAACIVVAVPVASAEAYASLIEMADSVVCLEIPEPFYGVGRFYNNFSQLDDNDVKILLAEAHPEHTRLAGVL